MIRFLIDSSAIWRLLREAPLRAAWADVVAAGAVGSCHPQRAEFRRSARSMDEYEAMSQMFVTQYPDVPVPKLAWAWVESAQYRLVRDGAHRAMSPIDLLICATAAYHGAVVLHDDNDYAAAARPLSDVADRRIHDTPPADG